MIKLNLDNPEHSDIKYKVTKYPDGQQDVLIFPDESKTLFHGYPDTQILIISKFNNFMDLELILCGTAALKNLGYKDIHLYTPYILGARSDRKFQNGSTSYLRDIVAPIINAQHYVTVTVVDPHSDVMEAVIHNLVKEDNTALVKFAVRDIYPLNSEGLDKLVLISPDAGAQKKIYTAAKALGIDNVITASKHRDIVTGNILSTEVPGIDQEPGQKTFMIVDDICDGGRTFIEIAKAIRSIRSKGIFNDRIYLVVTHGIFSAGLTTLEEHFNGIYCTNSFSDWSATKKDGSNPTLKQMDVY